MGIAAASNAFFQYFKLSIVPRLAVGPTLLLIFLLTGQRFYTSAQSFCAVKKIFAFLKKRLKCRSTEML
jgi:hypothetical protein